MKKKAQIEILAAVIVIIATLIFFILFQGKLGAEIKSEIPKEACKQSVKQNSLFRLGALDFSEEVTCPAQRIIIDEDLSTEKSQNKAKRIIGQAMADCWEQFGEGRLNLFSGDEIFCAPCAVIEFKNPKDNLKGFAEYFYTEKITEGAGKGRIYSEYLSGVTKGTVFEDNIMINVDKNLDIINTSQLYTVVFYYPKGKNNIDSFFRELSMTAPGAAIGAGAVAVGKGFCIIGGAVAATGLGAPAGAVICGAGIAIAATGVVIAGISTFIGITQGQVIDWAAFVYLKPYIREEAFKECTMLPVKQDEWFEQS